MKDNRTWILAMDFTEMDTNLLNYTLFLTNYWKPDHIHLLHVEKEREKNSYVPLEYEELAHQLAMESKLQMEHKANGFFKDSGISIHVHIKTGNALDEVLDLARNESASLVIAGRKKTSNGSGIVSDRLSRHLPCDFLLVPENSAPKLNKIMVTTDFSEHASLAMKTAVDIQNQNENIEVLSAHLYEVPWGYTKSGKSFEEFADIMHNNAKTEMSKWSKQFPPTQPVLKLIQDSTQQTILDMANDHQVDLLVMGSKGQSKVSYSLLGSVTMKVMKENDDLPLLVVKLPGENLDFIDALKRI